MYIHQKKINHVVQFFNFISFFFKQKCFQVTVLSTFPLPQKTLPENYHHIYVDVTDVEDWKNYRKAALHNGTKSSDKMELGGFLNAVDLIYVRSEQVVTHSIVQNLMKSNQKFDLFFLGYNINDMMLGLAGHFRVPSVLFSTIPPMKALRDMIGNPTAAASAPLFKETGGTNLNFGFYDRFGQFIAYTIEFCIATYVNQFYFEPFYNQHFPASKDFPTFDEVKKNVSLIMTNTHFAEGNIRPALPNLIEVGGVHIDETPNPLPKVRPNIDFGFLPEASIKMFSNPFRMFKKLLRLPTTV